MTDAELTELANIKITPKHQMVVVGDRVFARNGTNDWYECDLPVPPIFTRPERARAKLRVAR